MSKIQLPVAKPKRRPWNRGRLVGQKRPLLPKQVWAIRARLELSGNLRDLALFNLAIVSKLRVCLSNNVRLFLKCTVVRDISRGFAIDDLTIRSLNKTVFIHSSMCTQG